MAFYVYRLVDPRDNATFYIGKGKGRRAWQHTEAVKRNKPDSNQRKAARIQDILACGREPIVIVVQEFDDEAAAFDLEIALIAATSGLTNIRKGGEGWALSAEAQLVAEAQKAAKRAYRKAMTWRKTMGAWLRVVDTWPGVTFPNLPDGDAKAKELVEYVRERLAEPEPVRP